MILFPNGLHQQNPLIAGLPSIRKIKFPTLDVGEHETFNGSAPAQKANPNFESFSGDKNAPRTASLELCHCKIQLNHNFEHLLHNFRESV